MNDRVNSVIKHQAFIPAVTGVVSFAAGALTGYLLAHRSAKETLVHELPNGLQLRFDADDLQDLQGKRVDLVIIDEELTAENSGAIEDDEPTITEEDKRAMMQVDENVTITIAEHIEEEPPVIRRTVFAQNNGDWNMELELASRSRDAPYVLHHDEFYNQETDFDQTTLTYYSGDNILTDQEEIPIYDVETRVGELRFGHGSEDVNVFHVRNEKRKEEYEIVRVDDHYARAVQGLEIEEETEQELRHSRPMRMRREE